MGRLPAFEVSFETGSSLKVSSLNANAPGETTEDVRRQVTPSTCRRGRPGLHHEFLGMPEVGCGIGLLPVRSARGSEAGKGRKVSFETGSGLKVSSLVANAPEVRDGRASAIGCRAGRRGGVRSE